MLFDKHYRPERYNCITQEYAKFENNNHLRTHVLQNYFKFPIASTNFLKLGGYKDDFA